VGVVGVELPLPVSCVARGIVGIEQNQPLEEEASDRKRDSTQRSSSSTMSNGIVVSVDQICRREWEEEVTRPKKSQGEQLCKKRLSL